MICLLLNSISQFVGVFWSSDSDREDQLKKKHMTDRSIAEAQGQLGSLVQRYARLGVFSENSLEYTKIWRF